MKKNKRADAIKRRPVVREGVVGGLDLGFGALAALLRLAIAAVLGVFGLISHIRDGRRRVGALHLHLEGRADFRVQAKFNLVVTQGADRNLLTTNLFVINLFPFESE